MGGIINNCFISGKSNWISCDGGLARLEMLLIIYILGNGQIPVCELNYHNSIRNNDL